MIVHMTFSILYWNIWLNNQLEGMQGASRLLNELDRILELYQPDFIGLNEVLQAAGTKEAFVLDYIEKRHGYKYVHYAHSSPSTPEWFIGSAFLSRIQPKEVKAIPISTDAAAIIRGYHGHEVKAITATVPLTISKSVHIVVTHPLHLRPTIISEHYVGTRNVEKLMHSKKHSTNTILGGDINEPGFMPQSLRMKLRESMHFRSGNLFNPTWRHNAYRYTLIRANLDQLFWSKDSFFILEKFEVIDSIVSDHRPLFAEFSFK